MRPSPYLAQGVPVGDGFAWVGQHLVPVVSTQTLCIGACPTHAYHLIVSNSGEKYNSMH